MSQQAPALKHNQLVQKITELGRQENPDLMEVARVKRDVQALLKSGVEVQWCYVLLGMCGAIVFNESETLGNVRAALKLGYDPVHISNGALAIERVGRVSEAWALMRPQGPKDPLNIKTQRQCERLAVINFAFEEANAITQALQALKVPEAGKINQERAAEFLRSLEKAGYKASDAQARLEHVLVSLAARKVAVRAETFNFLPEGHLLVYLHIFREPDEAADLSFFIADTLVVNFEDTLDEYMSIACLANVFEEEEKALGEGLDERPSA